MCRVVFPMYNVMLRLLCFVCFVCLWVFVGYVFNVLVRCVCDLLCDVARCVF